MLSCWCCWEPKICWYVNVSRQHLCKAWRYFEISKMVYGGNKKMCTAEIISIKSTFMLKVSSQLTFEVYRFRLVLLVLCRAAETLSGRGSCLNSSIMLAVLSSPWSFWAVIKKRMVSEMGVCCSRLSCSLGNPCPIQTAWDWVPPPLCIQLPVDAPKRQQIRAQLLEFLPPV